MGLAIPGLLAILYLLQKLYLRTSRQIRFLDLEAKSPLYSHFLETLDGLSTIRAFGWQDQFNVISNERLDASQRPYYLLYCIQRWLNLVLQLLIGTMAVVVVALATSLRDTTSGGRIGIALNGILNFNGNVQLLFIFWTTLETSLGAIARLRSFAKHTVLEEQPKENFIPGDDWPSRGEVDFQNVYASYG